MISFVKTNNCKIVTHLVELVGDKKVTVHNLTFQCDPNVIDPEDIKDTQNFLQKNGWILHPRKTSDITPENEYDIRYFYHPNIAEERRKTR